MSRAPAREEGQPVPSAPLAEHRNLTPFPSQYFQNVDAHDRVFHVVVTKMTYDLAATPNGETLRLAEMQTPLAGGDEHYGDPGTSSVRWESDFVPYKPSCDVIVANAQAWAPDGVPTRRWHAGIGIDRERSFVDVTGPRCLKIGWTGVSSLTRPGKARSVPLRYEHAFGGTNVVFAASDRRRIERGETTSDDCTPLLHEAHPDNPIGCGFGSWSFHRCCGDSERPAPQIECENRPYTGQSTYPVAGLGVIGRHWHPRLQRAGTYDRRWKDERWPLLPLDFDGAYWNGAQFQVPHPKGGEGIGLLHLTPDGKRVWRLPQHKLFALAVLGNGTIAGKLACLDTLVFDLADMKLYASYRVCVLHVVELPLRALETCIEH